MLRFADIYYAVHSARLPTSSRHQFPAATPLFTLFTHSTLPARPAALINEKTLKVCADDGEAMLFTHE